MKLSVAFQTLVFLQAAVLGIGLGIAYDVLRAVRTVVGGARVTAVCDGIFWLVVLISGFVFVLTVGQGEGRLYILLGAVLGGMLYAASFSSVLFGVMKAALCAVLQTGCLVGRQMVRISRALYGTVGGLFKKICRLFKKRLSFSRKRG